MTDNNTPLGRENQSATPSALAPRRNSSAVIPIIGIISSLFTGPYHLIAAGLAVVTGVVATIFTAATPAIVTVSVVGVVYTLAIHRYYAGTAKNDYPPGSDRFLTAMASSILVAITLGPVVLLGLSGPIGIGLTVISMVHINFFMFATYRQDTRKYDLSPSKWWLAFTRVPSLTGLVGVVVGIISPLTLTYIVLGVAGTTFLYGLGRLFEDPEYSEDMREPRELERRHQSGRDHASSIYSQISQINDSLDRIDCDEEVETIAPGTTPDYKDVAQVESELSDLMELLYEEYPEEERLQKTIMNTQQEIQEMYSDVYGK